MGYFYKFIFLSGFLLFINIAMQSQNLESSYLRGDANVQFRWRFGYSEYPINRSSRTDLEDVTKEDTPGMMVFCGLELIKTGKTGRFME